MGTIAATFYLIGIGLLYAQTGTLNMADLASRLPELSHQRTTLVAFGFIVIGLGTKSALFPFHAWLPNVYTYAPSVITAFLAGTATKAALYVFARIMFTVTPIELFTDATSTYAIVLGLGIIGAIVASTIAIFQDNLKRLFAWSSIGQIGYMAVGVGLASAHGLAAGFLHLFNHALIKTSIFMALGGLFLTTGSTTLASLENAGPTYAMDDGGHPDRRTESDRGSIYNRFCKQVVHRCRCSECRVLVVGWLVAVGVIDRGSLRLENC